jgi:hypothetical protein
MVERPGVIVSFYVTNDQYQDKDSYKRMVKTSQ